MQEVQIWPFEQMVYAQPRIRPRNEMPKVLWDFEIQTNPLISARRLDLVIVKRRKKDNQPNSRLCRSGGPRGETEGKRKER